MTKAKVITISLLALVFIVGFNVLLNAGCPLAGAITAHGRVCIN